MQTTDEGSPRPVPYGQSKYLVGLVSALAERVTEMEKLPSECKKAFCSYKLLAERRQEALLSVIAALEEKVDDLEGRLCSAENLKVECSNLQASQTDSSYERELDRENAPLDEGRSGVIHMNFCEPSVSAPGDSNESSPRVGDRPALEDKDDEVEQEGGKTTTKDGVEFVTNPNHYGASEPEKEGAKTMAEKGKESSLHRHCGGRGPAQIQRRSSLCWLELENSGQEAMATEIKGLARSSWSRTRVMHTMTFTQAES